MSLELLVILIILISARNFILGYICNVNDRLERKKARFLDPRKLLFIKSQASSGFTKLKCCLDLLKNIELFKNFFIALCSLCCSVNCTLYDLKIREYKLYIYCFNVA